LPQAETSHVPEPQRGRATIQRLLRRKTVIVAGLGLAMLVATAVAYKLRGLLVPAAEALVRGIPIATPQALILTDLPVAQGPRISLFNNVDLNDWDGWLGYPDPAETQRDFHSADPVGVGGIGKDFKVVVEDGEPAIYVDGRTWGGLTHKGDYGDYHLSLQFKWGKKRHFSGLLYHSHGPAGAVQGTWMRSIEFEMIRGQLGMLVPVGRGLSSKTTVGRAPDLFNQQRRYMIGGREVDVTGMTSSWSALNATDQEKPVGDWNTLDLYVLGDRAIHVVNGVPVLEAWNICDVEHIAARCEPLTHGHIQFQAEGSETFFRHITLEPIKTLPRITLEP
jgi:3-keto-disaccharide hydrolase